MDKDIKVILSLLAERISLADSVEEAYNIVAKAAVLEGLDMPTYHEARDEKYGTP